VEGLVRRRRNLSTALSFLDIERTDEAAAGEPDESAVQLVCAGWECPQEIVAGMRVRATGEWERRPNGSIRFAVAPAGLLVVEDQRASNAWATAASHTAWRSRIGAQCACSDPECSRLHADSTRWQERRRLLAEKRALAAPPPDPHAASSAAKAMHNKVFAAWLIDTMGAEALRAGGGVVDVAGGRGMFALELALQHDIPVTLIEPRPVRLTRCESLTAPSFQHSSLVPTLADRRSLLPTPAADRTLPPHPAPLHRPLAFSTPPL
jgi:hypothetical protein